MREHDRLMKYDVAYFTKPRNWEIRQFLAGFVRRDMACAIAYALGYNTYDDACRALSCQENKKSQVGMTPGMITSLKPYRNPGVILDVGCGRGEMCAILSSMGYHVIGIDPAPGSYDLFFKTIKAWGGDVDRVEFMSMSALDGILGVQSANTIIFCESVEHIPAHELHRALDEAIDLLETFGGRLIITNQIAKHPILPDRTGYDHITKIDDELYGMIVLNANASWRRGSHLIADYGGPFILEVE